MTTAGSDIPKIQLEGKEDVLFLKNQFSEFLEKTLKTNAAVRDAPFTDAQRKEAQVLVLSKLDKWAESIWETAGRNITVNGFPYPEAMVEKSPIEPLDEALKAEVESLREEADSLLLSVANKRKTVPGQIEKLIRDSVWRESLAAEHTTGLKDSKDEDNSDKRDETGSLPFVDDRINGEFQSALAMARKLHENAPETISKLEGLVNTLEDTKSRIDSEKDDNEHVRWVLVDKPKEGSSGNLKKHNNTANANATQALAYRAALHAITSD